MNLKLYLEKKYGSSVDDQNIEYGVTTKVYALDAGCQKRMY